MAVSDLKTKARDAFRRRQYDLAVEMYLEALRFDPNDPETLDGFFTAAIKAREMKGKAIFGGMFSKVSIGKSRDPQKRMQACFRGLAKNPEDKGLLLTLGQAAGDADAGETAVAAYKRATEIDADDAEAWKRLGQFHGRRGRIKEALAALDEAVRLSPRDQESVKLRKNLAAEGALQTGRYDKAGSSRELMKDQDERPAPRGGGPSAADEGARGHGGRGDGDAHRGEPRGPPALRPAGRPLPAPEPRGGGARGPREGVEPRSPRTTTSRCASAT